MKEPSFSEKVKAEIASENFTMRSKEYNIDAKREYLADFFLRRGSMNDPSKSYHLELSCDGEDEAAALQMELGEYGIKSGQTKRKGRFVVYVKGGADVAAFIGLIGAPKSLMEMENRSILREMRGDVNRKVNCDAANISRAISAAGEQERAIRWLKENGVELPGPLRAAAEARLDNPEATLAELGGQMSPPLGKSGMNHRLQKLVALYHARSGK